VLGLLGGLATPATHAVTAATFGNPSSIAISQPMVAMVTGDVNHDGKPDLVAASYLGANGLYPGVYVLLGKGNGSFGNPTFWSLVDVVDPIVGLAVADLNGDGYPDIVTANSYGGDGSFGVSKIINVLLNSGSGKFGNAGQQTYSRGNGAYWPTASVAVSDVDGNGQPEVIVGSALAVDVWWYWSYQGSSGWSLGATCNAPATFGSNTTTLAVGDVNGDDKPDVVATGGGQVDVLLNTGNGVFAAAQTYVRTDS
jgi:hypothetical protein